MGNIDTKKRKKNILDFIHRQNEEIFHPAGFHIDNPFEYGLRMVKSLNIYIKYIVILFIFQIQISILSTGKIIDRIKSHNND